jgi:hypothetical protein
LMAGVITDDSPRAERLEIAVDELLHPHEYTRFQALISPRVLPADATWRVACECVMSVLHATDGDSHPISK